MDARTREALSRASMLIRKLKSEKEELANQKKGLAAANETLKAEVERLKGALKAKNSSLSSLSVSPKKASSTSSSAQKKHKKSELYEEIDQVLKEVIEEPPSKKIAATALLKCKKRRRNRDEACEMFRDALSSGGSVSSIADALCEIPYGTIVKFQPFRVRRQCQYRERLQRAQANETWSSRHVMVEILAWFRAYERDAKKCVDLICVLARRLGGDTLRVAFGNVSHAAVSWTSFLASLPESRKRQFDDAVAYYQKLFNSPKTEKDLPFLAALDAEDRRDSSSSSSSDEEDDDEPSTTLSTRSRSVTTTVSSRSETMMALLGALCDRFDLVGFADRVSEEVRLRGGGGDHAPVAIDNFDSSQLGLCAWLLIRENPLDETVAKIRERLISRLGDDPSVAAALLAAHSGESNDGVCRAVVAWAASLSRPENLPLRLLRRIAATRARPAVRVINLETAKDRRIAMARLALLHGIDLERCEAVDAANVDEKVPIEVVTERWSKRCCDLNAKFDNSSRGMTCSEEGEIFLSDTERACAASHVAQWRRAKNDVDRPVVIMEDDVVLAPGFAENTRKAFEYVPDDYDILLLGYFFPGGEIPNLKRESPPRVLRHFIRPAYFWGLHAYSLSPKGAAKLLRHLPVDGPADVFVARLVNDRTLTAYAVKTKLAKQRTQHTSSIHHTNRLDPGVTFNKAKKITFVDTLNDDSSEYLW